MAPPRPVSPEKQLLNLIEENKAQKNTRPLQARALKYQHLSFLSWGAWVGRFSFFKDSLRKSLHGGNSQFFDIKVINQVMIVCITILAVYFLFDFVSSLTGLLKIPRLEFRSSEKIRPLIFQEDSVLKTSASSYLEKVRGRDIFKIGSGTGETTENKEAAGPSPQVVSATANLKLVGISWSDDPDAIVEDTKTNKTYFVKTGDMVEEGKVEAIFKDRVVLKYGDQEAELK